MKRMMILFVFFIIISCEKKEPLFCYECETYMNDELLFTVSGCGMDNEHLHTLQIGMESEAWMILGLNAKVICNKIDF